MPRRNAVEWNGYYDLREDLSPRIDHDHPIRVTEEYYDEGMRSCYIPARDGQPSRSSGRSPSAARDRDRSRLRSVSFEEPNPPLWYPRVDRYNTRHRSPPLQRENTLKTSRSPSPHDLAYNGKVPDQQQFVNVNVFPNLDDREEPHGKAKRKDDEERLSPSEASRYQMRIDELLELDASRQRQLAAFQETDDKRRREVYALRATNAKYEGEIDDLRNRLGEVLSRQPPAAPPADTPRMVPMLSPYDRCYRQREVKTAFYEVAQGLQTVGDCFIPKRTIPVYGNEWQPGSEDHRAALDNIINHLEGIRLLMIACDMKDLADRDSGLRPAMQAYYRLEEELRVVGRDERSGRLILRSA